MKSSLALLFFTFLHINCFPIEINILLTGGKSDGQTLNTQIIQDAIDKVSESGGGSVIFPAGRFLTGSFHLKSGVNLFLQKGAIVLGSTNLADYTGIKPEFIALRTQTEVFQLIYSENQSDISITGEGTIDGQGEAFKVSGNVDEPGVTRPVLIQFIKCKNIRIEGVSLTNSGSWMQHYLACENIQIKGIKVYNHCNYNNDGIDIDGCRNVIVTDCNIDSDDDGICMKSTSPEPCENVVVSNCTVKSHCNALKLGTESTGGFKNISISNCTVSPSEGNDPFYGTINGQSAVSIEMVDGGILDGIVVSNISISETDCPVFIRLGNRARKYTSTAPEPGHGILRNVIISNLTAVTSSPICSNITGIPGNYAENISLSNIRITNLSNSENENINPIVPENDKGYPTPNMFGDSLPASGFFVRHVKNITFSDVQIKVEGENSLPAFVFHDVRRAILTGSVIKSPVKKAVLIEKDNQCEDIIIN